MKARPKTTPTVTEGFRSMGDRIGGELEQRLALAARALSYPVALFDDYFAAILPHDLVLLGAGTGLGKTQLALTIASAIARKDGCRAHYFALEAEPNELERRTKYAMLCHELWTARHPRAGEMRYTHWLLGRCEDICGHLNEQVDRKIKSELSELHTFYRGRDFGAEDLTRMLLRYHDETDLFVIDHIQYIDEEDGEDENRAATDLMKTIRDVGLRIGRPIVLVAHLRKRDERVHKLVPSLGDFHGSSNITKICTQIVTLERANEIEAPKWYLSPTFMAIAKDRREGAPPYVALSMYDLRVRAYRSTYTLGRPSGRKWKELPMGDVPSWANYHRPLNKDGEASPQEVIHLAQPARRDDVPPPSDDDAPHYANR